MIEITARAGSYRKGLLNAVAHLSPEEAAIISDLERYGLQVPQLQDVLCGGHVLVDDPDLYTEWRFEKVSHQRLSSHHPDIDKARYPDIGMRGRVMREKLHGRTAQGTWVQLEKTPAAFGKKKLPSLTDLRHLWDFVVYRVTRSNVGPWGLSRLTERRPMYLSPVVAVPTPLTAPVADSLASALRQIEAADDVTAVSQDLAGRFAPPERANPGPSSARRSPAGPGAGCSATLRCGSPRHRRGLRPRSCVSARRSRSSAAVSGGRCTMSDPEDKDAAMRPGPASVEDGLVSAVVSLVNTGPVLLGAYTVAELTAVDAIVDFLESRPSDEVLAEAVRSLAARQLLVAGSDGEQVQVRGDLGIAVAFQQRARMVLDARATGTQPGEPWRILLLPQPEEICLMVRIDALGVHEIGLYKVEDALKFLTEWVPEGPVADDKPGVDADAVLASAERAALITSTEYTTTGSAEIAGASTDLVLARYDGRLHIFTRDPDNRADLVPPPHEVNDVHDALADLLA